MRTALIAAALELVEDGGADALSIREVARRAGVSAMAPYRHFADRDALLAGAAAVGFARFTAAIAGADGEHDGREALIAQGVAYVGFAQANPALFRLMFGGGCIWSGEVADAAGAAYAVLAKRVAALVAPRYAEDCTLACWSIVHGLAMLSLDRLLDERGASAATLAARLLPLVHLPD